RRRLSTNRSTKPISRNRRGAKSWCSPHSASASGSRSRKLTVKAAPPFLSSPRPRLSPHSGAWGPASSVRAGAAKTMTPHDEARLIAAARKGDSRAYAALVDAHQQAVRGFLRRFAGHWADADDLAQEAFVTAWRKLSRFEGRSSFRSWVSG